MTKATRLILIMGLFGLTACETVSGAGQDIETAGEVIQRESNDVQY